MNVYIMVDAEGISGIYDKPQVLDTLPRYNEIRTLMTRDINVCVEACKDAGVGKVFVRDAHGGGNNVIWENLTSLADYYVIGDSGPIRWPGLEQCDAAILLGYHAMAGTKNAVLEHTMSSMSVQNYWINGEKAGEIALDAAIVGDQGKPVIMVSGDDKACAEAKAVLPWVVTAEVKKGLTAFGAMLLPPERAYTVIREKTKEAIANYPKAKPYILAKPVVLKVECTERTQLPNPKAKPYMKLIDGRIYEVSGDTMEEAWFRNM
jgi:D-amino peptidase